MYKIYEAFDTAIMGGVNQGVRAWNYVTGKTKADLANILGVGSAVMFTFGAFHIDKNFGYIFGSLSLLGGIATPMANNHQERKEISAMEKGLKDPYVEGRKEFQKKSGAIMGIGSLMVLPGAVSGRESSIDLCIGGFLSTAESYIMRAENYPRRKNIFSRSMDSLRETLEQYQLQRQPIPIKAYYSGGQR